MNEFQLNTQPKLDLNGNPIEGQTCTWVTGTITDIGTNAQYTKSRTMPDGTVVKYATKEEREANGTPFVPVELTINTPSGVQIVDANLWKGSQDANELAFKSGKQVAIHFDLQGLYTNTCWVGLLPKRGVKASFYEALGMVEQENVQTPEPVNIGS